MQILIWVAVGQLSSGSIPMTPPMQKSWEQEVIVHQGDGK